MSVPVGNLECKPECRAICPMANKDDRTVSTTTVWGKPYTISSLTLNRDGDTPIKVIATLSQDEKKQDIPVSSEAIACDDLFWAISHDTTGAASRKKCDRLEEKNGEKYYGDNTNNIWMSVGPPEMFG